MSLIGSNISPPVFWPEGAKNSYASNTFDKGSSEIKEESDNLNSVTSLSPRMTLLPTSSEKFIVGMTIDGDDADFKSGTYENSEKETDLDMNGESVHTDMMIDENN
jgi:hypothetical protein